MILSVQFWCIAFNTFFFEFMYILYQVRFERTFLNISPSIFCCCLRYVMHCVANLLHVCHLSHENPFHHIFFHIKSHLIQLWNLYDINIEIFYCFIRHVYISKGANDECAELCDDTTSGSKGSFWIRLNRYIIRLCSTHQFKNLQVNRCWQKQ